MYHRHKGGGKLQQWMRVIVVLVTVLFVSAIPGHTRSDGGHGGKGHGSHGGHSWGGHGSHSGHGWKGHGFHGVHGWKGHGYYGGHGWRGYGYYGGHGWKSVGVSIGIGPYWGPYWGSYGYPYAYSYGYPYTYPPQIYVQPSPRSSIQPPSSPPVWYYCEDPQGYYPHVQQCPGGWRTGTGAPSPQ